MVSPHYIDLGDDSIREGSLTLRILPGYSITPGLFVFVRNFAKHQKSFAPPMSLMPEMSREMYHGRLLGVPNSVALNR